MAEAVKRVFATEEAKAADANKPKPAAEASATARRRCAAARLPMPWIIGGAVFVAAGGVGAAVYFSKKKSLASFATSSRDEEGPGDSPGPSWYGRAGGD